VTRARPTQRLRRDASRPPRVSAELLADLAARLTDRDRAILDLVWEHRAFTTHQLTAIFFTSQVKARHRLLDLHRHGALDRFRPWTPQGSAPWHHVLGPAGAAVLAARRGTTPAELGYRRDTALAISHSAALAHQIGVNDFFTHLHASARNGAGALEAWWSERRCAALWGDLARPDAYGRWAEPRAVGKYAGHTTGTTADERTQEQDRGAPRGEDAGRHVDFFLEHDTGTEPLTRVADKLTGYAALAEATGIHTPVLFWLPSTRREARFRHLIGTPDLPVATAVHTPTIHTPPGPTCGGESGPAGPVWLPAGPGSPGAGSPGAGVDRRRLIDLADAWPPLSTQPLRSHPPARHDACALGPYGAEAGHTGGGQ
jgi:hypothetical protein